MLRALFNLVRLLYLLAVVPLFLLVLASFAIGGYSSFGDVLTVGAMLVLPFLWDFIKGYRSARSA